MKVMPIDKPCADNRLDLQDMARVELNDKHRAMLDEAAASMRDDPIWSQRKAQEIHDALAMVQTAGDGDLDVLAINARDELGLLLYMRVPVPVMLKPGGELLIVDHALIDLRYPRQIMIQNLPGTRFIRVREPRFVWLGNVDPIRGVGCLGKVVPRNTPCRELILLTFSMLCAQTQMNDEEDHAGVINREAAKWWSLNPQRSPLTDRTLFDESPSEAHDALGNKEIA